LSALLAAVLIPALIRLNLPVAFEWKRLIVSYWLVLAAQSLFVVVLLLLLDSPRQVLQSFWDRMKSNYLLLFPLAIFFGVLVYALSWWKGLILTVDTIAILEFRRTDDRSRRAAAFSALFLASAYLFAGFLLVFAYNDVILSIRFFASADGMFNAVDQWLMHGWSVSKMAAWAVQHLPRGTFDWLEFIYFGMFTQIGAALMLTSLASRERGQRFVGTILTAYYLALVLFYLWPSQGPYYLSGGALPGDLMVSAIQKQSIANSMALWSHRPIAFISTDYYIAFPCMHIAQPLIVMWFLRSSRRIVWALIAYDLLLIPAIILLEWHYVVDLLGGVLVAAAAITIVNVDQLFRRMSHGESTT
jgi:hypothetical protein